MPQKKETMNVLAHIVLNGPLSSEPAATLALAHILKSPNIRNAFMEILPPDIRFECGSIKSEIGHGDARPDLTIHDSQGHVRVFVENKFWAGLTSAQPVDYLSKLSKERPTALLFIVPKQRVVTIWKELKQRCKEKGFEYGNEEEKPEITWCKVDSSILLITNWTHVLNILEKEAKSRQASDIHRDILQLQGLIEEVDSKEAFLPIDPEEITDQKTAHRLVNYLGLIGSITDKLRDKEYIRASSSACSQPSIGRYLKWNSEEKIDVWLGIRFDVWRDVGITPLWCHFVDKTFEQLTGDSRRIDKDLKDLECRNDVGEGGFWFPIRLKTGVDCDEVVEDAATKIKAIVDRCQTRITDS